MKIHTKYSRSNRRPTLKCGASITDSSFAKDLGIDVIVNRCRSGAPLKAYQVARSKPVYGDATALPRNAEDAWNRLDCARADWDKVPAAIKEKFTYDEFSAIVQSGDLTPIDNALKSIAETYNKTTTVKENTDASQEVK